MADTKRLLSELITLLATTPNGISAQDIRDMLVSLAPPMGSVGMTANAAATTIATAGTFEIIAGTFVASGSPIEVTEGATGRLTYTGAPNRHFHIVSNFDFIVGANNQIAKFQWFKNGTAIGHPVRRKVGTGADVGAVSIHADAMLSTSDYLELKVTNETSTASVTVEDAYNFVMGMIHA